MHERGEVPTVIEDQVEGLVVFEGGELLFQAPIVFFFRFAFPGEDGGAGGGDGGGGVVLCAELGSLLDSAGESDVCGVGRRAMDVRCCNLTR